MQYIQIYEPPQGVDIDPLRALEQTATDAPFILCRVRRSADGVLFAQNDALLIDRCSLDKRVDQLTFKEISALYTLCGYNVLTFEQLMNYQGKKRVVLHLRGFRPSARILSWIAENPMFGIGSDSVVQMPALIEGYPTLKTIGFACYMPIAVQLLEAGACGIVMYGRHLSQYTAAELAPLRGKPLYIEPLIDYIETAETAARYADGLPVDGIVSGKMTAPEGRNR